MASEQQIAANRRNAQQSTGPRTPEGKAAVRYNGLRHGLYAAAIVLPGESQEEFDQLVAEIKLDPQNSCQRYFLEQMAASEWLQARLARSLPKLLAHESDPIKQFLLQDKHDQYLARLQRAHSRAFKHWRTLLKQSTPPPAKPEEPARQPETYPETRGWAFLDENGIANVDACPKIQTPDGKWHCLPQSLWPKEYFVAGPPIVGDIVLEQMKDEPPVPDDFFDHDHPEYDQFRKSGAQRRAPARRPADRHNGEPSNGRVADGGGPDDP